MKKSETEITLEEICGPVSNRLKLDSTPRLPVKQPGQVSPQTRYARELFFHGNGDGKPIRNAQKLADKAGVSVKTVERWLPIWERESRAKAVSATAGKVILRGEVTAEAIALHTDDVATLRTECSRLKLVLKTLPSGTDAHEKALKLYTATMKAWAQESGLHDHFETATVANREMIKISLKAQGRGNDSGERNVTPGNFNFSVQPALPDKSE